MYSRHAMRRVLVLLLSLCFVPAAFAGSFKVNPLSIEFKPATKATVLKIINTGEEDVTVQLDTRKWLQDSKGQDYYENTTEVVFFPKIVTLKPSEERVVRVGFRGKREAGEKTFRLFVQELPNRSGRVGTLNFALRLSIPVFIKPAVSKPQTELAEVLVDKGMTTVRVENHGNQHESVKKIRLTGFAENRKKLFTHEVDGWYVLSGTAKPFEVQVPESFCRDTKRLRVDVEYRSRQESRTLKVNDSQC